MGKEQKILEELIGSKPEKLTGEAKRLFEAMMKIADEGDELLEKNKEYEKQLDLDYVEENYIHKDKIKKEIEELKKYEKYYEEMEEVNKKFIAVDKIKAKIEKIEKEIKVKREIAKKPIDRVTGRLLSDSIVELEKQQSILQSLLEEEE